MSEIIDIGHAVELLVHAWRTGHQLRELPEGARPRNMSEGYDLQECFVAALNQPTVGWKLGVGSHKAKVASGIGRSIAGRVTADRLFRSGDAIVMPDRAPVTIEIELAFVLARDIAPDEVIDDPLSVISGARLTAELVRSRFIDRRAVGWPSFAADDAGFHALVVGPVIQLSDLPTLRDTLAVTVDGITRAQAALADDTTEPLHAMQDLLTIAASRGTVLSSASLVSTGSQSQPFMVTDAGAVHAKSALGELRFSLL